MEMLEREVFADLMSVAQETPEIKEQLITILSLESSRRKVLLDVLLHHSALQKAPKVLQTIFTRFLNDDFAHEVLQLLRTS